MRKASETNSPVHTLTAVGCDSIVPESEFHKHVSIIPGTKALKSKPGSTPTAPASVQVPKSDAAGHGKILLVKVQGKGTADSIREGIIKALALLYRWSVSTDRTKSPVGRPKDEETARGERAFSEALDSLGWTLRDFNREANLLIANSKPQGQTLIKATASGKVNGVEVMARTIRLSAADVIGGKVLKAGEDNNGVFPVGESFTLTVRIDAADVQALHDANADADATVADALAELAANQ